MGRVFEKELVEELSTQLNLERKRHMNKMLEMIRNDLFFRWKPIKDKPVVVFGGDVELRWLRLPSEPEDQKFIYFLWSIAIQLKRFFVNQVSKLAFALWSHLVVGVVRIVEDGEDVAHCEHHCCQARGPESKVWKQYMAGCSFWWESKLSLRGWCSNR